MIIKKNAIEKINNIEALGLYVYMLSCNNPSLLKKSFLRLKFNIGIDRLNRILKYLSNIELIEIVNIKSTNGRFIGSRIIICS